MEKQSNHDSNKTAIRNLLEAGEVISVKSVWRVLKTTETRHYLSQLRRDGMKILDRWTRNANNQRHKEWWISVAEIEA